MRIVLVTRFVLDPLMLEERGMGGAQTGVPMIAKALASLGHEVLVFTKKCPHPGLYAGVEYLPTHKLAESCREMEVDVLIAVPPFLPLFFPIQARTRVVWTGQSCPHGKADWALKLNWEGDPTQEVPAKRVRLFPLVQWHWLVDRIFSKSEWQTGRMVHAGGIPQQKIYVTRNGVPLEYFPVSLPEKRHRHRLVYLSVARHGLDVLLEVFPLIRKRVPDCELHIFSYEVGDTISLENLKSSFANADHPGVVWHGSLPKHQLAHELLSAAVLAYPCRYHETFSTAVAEAQAAGLPVVTSALAALTERVEHGVDGLLIPVVSGQDISKDAYQREFVERVIELLCNDRLWEKMSQRAREKAHGLYNWDTIAQGWETQLTTLIQGRSPLLPFIPGEFNLLDPQWREIKLKGRQVQLPLPTVKAELERQCRAHGFTLEETRWVS